MTSTLVTRLPLRLLVLTLVVSVPLLIAYERTHDLPPPIPVTVPGGTISVEPGTTFGQVVEVLQIQATSGRLLDVEGKVLQYRADPGRILLNGLAALRSTRLSSGDEITVVNGQDMNEGTTRVTERLKGIRPGNPQVNLATSHVIEIRVEGRISGKVVRVSYHQIGKARTPPAVALTFDDGPWPGSSERILSILERMHVKATFFVVGSLAERYPGILGDELAAGMTIGNHSWSHPTHPPFAKLKPHRMAAEMADTNALLGDLGVDPVLFRPPGGSWNGEVVQAARMNGMRVVTWGVDPHDYLDRATAKGITKTVLHNVRPGSIVLMHDGGGNQSATVKALPAIIKGIRKMGLQLVAIPQ